MKKFLLVFAIIFVVNLSCKKEQLICGCSPIETPTIHLAIRNAAGADLLNSATTGSFAQKDIQLFMLDESGNTKSINFIIRKPFSYGNEKFPAYQIYTSQLFAEAYTPGKKFYLRFGSQTTLELMIDVSRMSMKVNKLVVDHKEVPRETGTISSYVLNLYYLTIS